VFAWFNKDSFDPVRIFINQRVADILHATVIRHWVITFQDSTGSWKGKPGRHGGLAGTPG
jgi:hypothetical protein